MFCKSVKILWFIILSLFSSPNVNIKIRGAIWSKAQVINKRNAWNGWTTCHLTMTWRYRLFKRKFYNAQFLFILDGNVDKGISHLYNIVNKLGKLHQRYNLHTTSNALKKLLMRNLFCVLFNDNVLNEAFLIGSSNYSLKNPM